MKWEKGILEPLVSYAFFDYSFDSRVLFIFFFFVYVCVCVSVLMVLGKFIRCCSLWRLFICVFMVKG